VEFIFLCFGIKASLAEILEYFLNILAIFRHVVWVDKYIIQINYNTDIQEIGKKIINELLESYKSIGKTEEHYILFKWSIICPKSSLPFITVKWCEPSGEYGKDLSLYIFKLCEMSLVD